MDPGYHRRYRLATLCMGPELRARAERRVSPAAGAPIRPEGERNGLVAGKGPALSVGQGRIAADSASAASNPAPPARKKCRRTGAPSAPTESPSAQWLGAGIFLGLIGKGAC